SLAGHPTDTSPARRLWIAVPVLFVIWANLQSSFVCGLALLGCLAAGRGGEVLWRTRSLRGALADRPFQRWTLLTELSAAATLVNPYGIHLWIDVARFGRNPILARTSDWMPLTLAGP